MRSLFWQHTNLDKTPCAMQWRLRCSLEALQTRFQLSGLVLRAVLQHESSFEGCDSFLAQTPSPCAASLPFLQGASRWLAGAVPPGHLKPETARAWFLSTCSPLQHCCGLPSPFSLHRLFASKSDDKQRTLTGTCMCRRMAAALRLTSELLHVKAHSFDQNGVGCARKCFRWTHTEGQGMGRDVLIADQWKATQFDFGTRDGHLRNAAWLW